MCIFSQPSPPPAPKPLPPAPSVKPVAPPPEMGTPEAVEDETSAKISTKKKKALQVEKVHQGVKEFGAVDATSGTLPTSPTQGITTP